VQIQFDKPLCRRDPILLSEQAARMRQSPWMKPTAPISENIALAAN